MGQRITMARILVSLSAMAIWAFPLISKAQSAPHMCPAGQVVQGVDFVKRSLICAPLPGGSRSNALRVVDDRGQLVGMLMGVNSVVRRFGDEWYSFDGFQTGFADKAVALLYESVDCGGTAFVRTSPSSLPRSAQNLGGGGSTTFYIGVPGTATTITVAGVRTLSAADPGGICKQQSPTLSAEVEVSMPVNVTTALPWRLTTD